MGFSLCLSLALTNCTVGPDYLRPAAPVPVAYKELKGWKRAVPRDDRDRGPWWVVFKDKKLDGLEPQIAISNQTVAASEAAYRQSLALIKETQAGLFPTITVNYNPTGFHDGASVAGGSGGVSTTRAISTLSANATWDLDLWGEIRRTIESDVSGAQVSAADIANAKLSTQSLLATAYYNLRSADALQALLDRSVNAFRRTLAITQNQYAAGTVSKADVATALAQVLNTQSQAINVGIQRAQFEHAIAALIGRPPAELAIPASPLGYKLPDIPVSIPSALLERRPDIAAAERAMQQQNALIGAAIALYYPDVTLSGLFGFMGSGALALSLANEVWTVGATAVQTAFDAGLRDAQVEAAMAAYQQSVANYRQVVLTAFQQVEDQLAAVRILARQQIVADGAVKAAQVELDTLLNQYRAGTVAFTAVVVAQATLLSDEQSALAVRQNRFLATVALIEALGGGWDATELPNDIELETLNPIIPRL
ncbi:efflux transporter outer membrane subunit [Methylocapsa sp. D3K7]|uniref:efflux transporter outer membrane subunit n=1 Tax=Methylocapsa sp. D3K7 TaxID=3041435 RepID=UPI00244EA716|nr:efflux transporter outer membrane subunit [Methylocapsa sp. D3K7]WGJ14420.1 efflux transporter outer membrane subunit [Methylocapsa sp. D3K7]